MSAVALHVERIAPANEAPGAETKLPVLIAHGLFGAGRNWAGIAKILAEDRPAAVADLRNHGQSPWTESMDYAAMGQDLLAAAQAEFGRPCALIGHSMGGKSALAAALQAPEQVVFAAIVDIAPVDYVALGKDREHGGYIDALRRLDIAGLQRRADADALLAEAAPDPAIRAFLLQNLVTIPGAGPGEPRFRWRLNLAGLAAALPALMGWPAALAEQRYPGPLLALAGGASDYVGAEGETALTAQAPNARIERMPGRGHWLHAEAPQETASILRAALGRLNA